jgi:class 3 adenylate cyclase
VRTLRMTPVRFEVGARAHRPDDVYRSYLDQSDVFVGIYWESYGWVSPGATVSGIEDELERSRERPQLIYVKEPAPNRDPALRALLEGIREGALTTYRSFGAPGELSELVLDDLAVLLTERFQTARGAARDLPEGTVTFVFVDMADSTRIAGERPGAYPAIVGTFQTALAETVGRHGGVVVDTEGDGAFCVFSRVDDAATAAVSFQRDVLERPWPADVMVLARIGIHTGSAEGTASSYVGLEVHRAARIGAAANGGQILVSRVAANLLGTGSLDGSQFADLGSFALKGLDRAEELLQLAIELAAARMRILDPASLLERLSRKLDVVGGSVPDLPERQRTLTATIEWSYDLLDEAERTLLARLAVFVGGWTIEAAENVCSGGVVSDVLTALERLSEHSLLVAEPASAGGPRMRMLETIREFAAAKLEASAEADVLRERHASYYERLIVELHAQPGGETAPVAIARLDGDWDDVLACMEWRFLQDDYTQLVQLASRTWRYLWLRDHFNELAPWLTAAYAARDTLEPGLRGELCRLWGSGCYQAGMFEPARDAVEEAVRLLAETGPVDREAWARTVLGGLLPYFEGDLDRPFAEVARAVELFRADENVFGLATTLGMLGTISLLLGRTDEAMSQLQDGMVLAEQLGLAELVGSHHSFRALAHLARDEIQAARRHLDAAVAAPLYLEGTAYCLEGYAAVLAAEGDVVLATTALGAAEGLRERTGIAMWPLMNMILRDRLASLEAAGPAAAAARYDGRQMSPAEALALVRAG